MQILATADHQFLIINIEISSLKYSPVIEEHHDTLLHTFVLTFRSFSSKIYAKWGDLFDVIMIFRVTR